ncbi:hypothetical protein CF327_g542 [Tilletia walkeri]|nr:hypothetical protein CF327_g542 [Tilletia walkeri]
MASRPMMQAHIPAAPAIERTVVFANLPAEVNEYWLRSVLAPLGPVQSVEISQGPGGTLQAKVAFPTTDQAQAALHFHGQMALGQPMQIQLPQDAYLKNTQHFVQPQMGRYPLALNVDLNSNHGGRPRIAGQLPLGGQRHRGVELEPTHKNLYVLNLPLDATTDQLAALFGHYGAVVHCVILAMLDAQARRRGFIDMASPDGAKEAIEALNGFVWHGYPIEVSYAIVQRSGGPFEQAAGRHVIKRNVPRNRFNTGPRRVPSDATVSPLLAAAGRHPAMLGGGSSVGSMGAANGIVGFNSPGMQHGQGSYDPMMGANYADIQGRNIEFPTMGGMSSGSALEHGGPLPSDPCTLFISGLDPVAILDDEDLRHELEVYGPVQAVSLSRDESNKSRGFGMVTYTHEGSARKAKAALDGKFFHGRKVSAHHLPFDRNIPDFMPLSVNAGPMRSPMGTSSGLPATMSVMDGGSLAASPEYRRAPSGYPMGGTPASMAASVHGSSSGNGLGYGHTNFSTPQPQSTSSSNSDFLSYSLPLVPATDGAQSSTSLNRQHQHQHSYHQNPHQQQPANFSYHLDFSPDNWSAASTRGFSDIRSPGESVNGSRYGMQGNVDASAVLAEPFVHRSHSGNVHGSSANPGMDNAEDASKAYPLGAAFQSPSAQSLSPSTLKSNAGGFSNGGVFASSGSRGPLDSSSFEFYPSDKGTEAGQQSGPQSGSGNSRPLSRTSGSLGVTLGSDVAASIAAAAGAPPMFFSKAAAATSRPGQGQGQQGQSSITEEASTAEQVRNGGATMDSTPKLDGQAFPGSVHSTPLNRRGNGYGHAHMYSHITRSAGPGTSIGSMGSISHTGSTSALSSWARTPQSSLSSLEQISPGSGSSALGNGTPAGLAFKQAESHDETSGNAYTSFSGGNGEHRSMHSASASRPWAGFPGGGNGMAPWTSPQAVAGSFSSKEDSIRSGAPQGPSSDSSSVTETNGGHSALRSLHQGSPPYSAALDSGYRKVPLAPVGHEKSTSITSPRTRLSSGSNGAVGSNGAASSRSSTNGAGYQDKVNLDLSGAVAGLNIST